MLLESPPHFFATFLLGCLVSFLIGMYFSTPAVWQRLFPKGGYLLYKKVGEYGEYDHFPSKWSPLNEPLNAWTSLIYTVCGVMILCCGLNDSTVTPGQEANNLMRAYLLSIFYGLSCMYLGVASFLFHASHAETWRKADAGMTSGVVISAVVFGVYDRFCPPALVLPYLLCIAIVLQVSLTHGYLPYGSSDVLLPSLVAFIWVTELLPRYGGVVDTGQYGLWFECCYSVLVGFLLRIVDIKRNNPSVYKNLLRILLVLSIFPFSWALGFTDPVLLFGFFALLVVCHSPWLGHIFWHFGSAGALFIWWYLLRVRPGDMAQSEGAKHDLSYYCVFYLPEHPELSLAAPYKAGGSLFESDGGAEEGGGGGGSWAYKTLLCWSGAVYPTELFHLYYLAKVGSHLEDLVYMCWRKYVTTRSSTADAAASPSPSPPLALHDPEADSLISGPSSSSASASVSGSSDKEKERCGDQAMVAHHIITAALCLGSWALNYTRIGSVVMFLHDISDVPLDLVRLCGSFGYMQAQVACMALTLVTWAYWRLYYMNVYVLYTVAFESRSVILFSFCSPESSLFLMRTLFVLLLGSLSALHCHWFWLMLEKTYKAWPRLGAH